MRNKRPDNNEDFMETHRYGHPSVRPAMKWWAAIFRWHFVNRNLKNAAWESILGQEHENLEEVSGGGTHHQKVWSCLLERNNQFKKYPPLTLTLLSFSWCRSSLKRGFNLWEQVFISSAIFCGGWAMSWGYLADADGTWIAKQRQDPLHLLFELDFASLSLIPFWA